MLERIQGHILDLLQGDARLWQGGNAFAAGWAGVKRPDNGVDTATAGYVNLYDASMEPSGVGHLPGIYLGLKALEATDDLDFLTCSAANRHVEYRRLIVPLVIVAQAQGHGAKPAARGQRNQLRGNLLNILFDHRIEPGFWYEATFPGALGGGPAVERAWVSATGQGAQSAAVAFSTLPLLVRYSRGSNAPA